jgi:Ion channel
VAVPGNGEWPLTTGGLPGGRTCAGPASVLLQPVRSTRLTLRLGKEHQLFGPWLSLAVGLALIAVLLWDAFETIVLPRSVGRRLRLARLYFRGTWWPWARIAGTIDSDKRRERFLAIYGPLSLMGLVMVWAAGLIFGFAMLHWAAGSRLVTPAGKAGFVDDLYMSGTTFFTLGLGDVHPVGAAARAMTVAEAGMGFGFLALALAYFPVLYQSFSRREVRLTLLDAWAGSPPAAAEVLRRLGEARDPKALDQFLRDWEYWCSEVMESHISYPVVAYFRSQHQRQSWVAALGAVLDVSALVLVGIEGLPTWQARLTFAVARHTVVDLTQVLHARPDPAANRLPPDDLEQLRRQLEGTGLHPNRSRQADARLAELRRSYEPYVVGLGRALLMSPPPWWHPEPVSDNWETSPKRDGGPHL